MMFAHQNRTQIFKSFKVSYCVQRNAAIKKILKFLAAPLAESEQDFEDDFIRQLQASVKEVKESREMGARYMTFGELLDEEKIEAREEGRLLKLKEQVERKLAKGWSLEKIAEVFEEDMEDIQEAMKVQEREPREW